MKKIIAILVLLCLLPAAVAAEPYDTDDLIVEMIADYDAYGDKAVGSIRILLAELEKADPEKAAVWNHLMRYWYKINRAKVNYDRLPDDLEQTDELCLAVLGYQLDPDGSIRPELELRLKTLLKCASQYPNAYILCTGGGTASEAPDITEADAMAEWLIEHGIDESRIIREKESLTTTQNARYSCPLLRENYPQIHSVAVITSDYHIPSGCMMFESEGLLNCGNAEPIRVAAHAACRVPVNSGYPFRYQAIGLLAIAGLRERSDAWKEAHPGKPVLRK